MSVDIDTFVAAVEDRLPCLFIAQAQDLETSVLAGSETRIDLDQAKMRLEFSTPVPGAHDGLSKRALLDLMTFNFPNDLTRSSFLAAGGGAGHLVLTASLSLDGATAEAACDAILDQIAAALALAERIAQDTKNGSPQDAA